MWPSWNGSSPAVDPALLRGIAAYRRHPWHRTLPDPAPLWTEGAARLLDYAPPAASWGAAPGLPTVVFVPSLVNRASILDLMPGQSLMRWLAERRVRPLLLDWGWPGAERHYTLTDYVTGPLERALAAAQVARSGPVVLAGYCMGGMLALAAALRRPDLVRGLVLLATPWDFHAGTDPARRARPALPLLEPMLDATGTLPVDALQALFASLDPGSIAAKFRAFGAMDQASDAAARFVALEDWLNDGVPLAAPVAREALDGWYGANTPAQGTWCIAGEPVAPQRLGVPSFVAVPARDRIVPPGSALALAGLLPDTTLHRAQSGHIGMAAGPRAEAGLWEPLLGWLRGLGPPR